VFDLDQLSGQYPPYYCVLGSALFHPNLFDKYAGGVARLQKTPAVRLCAVGKRVMI